MRAGVVQGDDCTAACVGCDPNPGMAGGMHYVGCGSGDYMAQSTYRYVGYGGDFSNVRRRRDFTCLITTLLLSMLLLLLAWWWLWPTDECFEDQQDWQYKWGRARQMRCCARVGIGCDKATPPPGPVDPFNCASGYLNWKGGWSVSKKQWCCKVHGKGCPENGEGWAAQPASEYDCNAGYENWVKGWSMVKKQWCCNKFQKGCPGSGAENLLQAAGEGFGAGAQYGVSAAPVANPLLGTSR